MLLFIALANVVHYTWARPLTTSGFHADSSTLDSVLLLLEQLLVHDRSRPMFAVLYGFGIAMIASRLLERGVSARDARHLIRRRSWWLIALGAAHSVLLFAGDILAPYGVTGLIVAAWYGRSTAWLRRAAALSGVVVTLVAIPIYALLLAQGTGTLADDTAAPATGFSYLESMLTGLVGTLLTSTIAGAFLFFVPLTSVGMLIHRAGWLTAPGDHLPALRRTAIAGVLTGVVSALPIALIAVGVWAASPAVHGAALWLTVTGGMAGGVGYVAVFALLGHRWESQRERSGVRALAALGSRSLSGYLAQSLVMAPLLSPWGFGLGEGLGYAGAFAIAAATWALTVVLAAWFDARGWRGPFEVLLRRLTYGDRAQASPPPARAATS